MLPQMWSLYPPSAFLYRPSTATRILLIQTIKPNWHLSNIDHQPKLYPLQYRPSTLSEVSAKNFFFPLFRFFPEWTIQSLAASWILITNLLLFAKVCNTSEVFVKGLHSPSGILWHIYQSNAEILWDQETCPIKIQRGYLFTHLRRD